MSIPLELNARFGYKLLQIRVGKLLKEAGFPRECRVFSFIDATGFHFFECNTKTMSAVSSIIHFDTHLCNCVLGVPSQGVRPNQPQLRTLSVDGSHKNAKPLRFVTVKNALKKKQPQQQKNSCCDRPPLALPLSPAGRRR